MKNLLLVLVAFFLVASCSKESIILDIESPQVIDNGLANISVRAIYAGTNIPATTSPESNNSDSNYSCNGSSGIVNTTIGLFYKTDNIAADVDIADADFSIFSANGNAYFREMEPGSYTVVVQNEMGNAMVVEIIEIGPNDVTIEF